MNQMHLNDKSPIQWAQGWPRTPIGDRRQQRAWKKPLAHYRNNLIEQLRKVGATEVLITYNDSEGARLDPAVTVYFSKGAEVDYSWQVHLGLDNPAPTLKEIDDAFRDKAMKFHPDRPGGDVKIYQELVAHRDRAKRYVLGKETQELEFALACDRFSELRWNIQALALSVMALRRLEDYGVPGMLERTFKGFKTQIADQRGANGESTISA